LQRYTHLPEAKAAMGGLVKQQLGLMMSVWRPRHHICENFPSIQLPANVTGAGGGNQCTGNHFYIWGGLPAFTALLDAGLYT